MVLQPLVQALVQACDTGKGSLLDAIAALQACCDLSIVPVPLVERLQRHSRWLNCQDIYSWQGLVDVGSAMTKLGVGVHEDTSSQQQLGIQQPLVFLAAFVERAQSMMREEQMARAVRSAAARQPVRSASP